MTNMQSLFLTFFVGIFFLIGLVIPKFFKNQKGITTFSIGLAFSVMMGMLVFDLLPELNEVFLEEVFWKRIGMILFGIFFGLGILVVMDLFVPEHHHEHHEGEKNKKEHNYHMYHVGFITALSLVLHNMIEGISIYTTALSNLSTGFLFALGVGLHNIALGIEVSASMEQVKDKNKLKYGMQVLLIFSSFLGAGFIYLFPGIITEAFQSFLLCITIGMILYIIFFEFIKEIWGYRKEKNCYYGLFLGIVISLLLAVF